MAFPNGVAAGDITETSGVLWARSTVPGPVTFDYATDREFGAIVGTATATTTDPALPVKVAIDGLDPNARYFYRAIAADGSTATGTFRTAPPLGTVQGVRFGVAPDWLGELAPYPAIANADDRELDFFVLLGDTIYADTASPAVDKPQAETLEEFRLKYDEVYGPRFGLNTWADLRASTALLATIDDHEITNDVPGAAPPNSVEAFAGDPAEYINDAVLYETGMQAFQEYLPLRDEFYGDTGDPVTAEERKLYRYQPYGNDAAVFVLDARSFRSEPLPFLSETASEEATTAYLQDAFDPEKTMLGAVQLADFKRDLLAAERAGATWKFVFSSVPIQHFGIPVAGERWEGYAAERAEILQFVRDNNIENVVFVSGDFHGNVVNNVTLQTGFGQPQSPTGVIDIMTGPVAYQLNLGDGPFGAPFGPAMVAFTPDVVLPESEKARYETLSRSEKDDFVEAVVNARLLKFGYDPIGLEGSGTNAELRQGTYSQSHVFTWTEFAVDPQTQELTVTSYGIDSYSQPELEADPAAIAARAPEVTQQFTLGASRTIAGTDGPEAIAGDALHNKLLGLAGDDTLTGATGNDLLAGGPGSDAIAGGPGNDLATYGDAAGGVVADLAIGEVRTPAGDIDTLDSVENLAGSEFADTLTGDAGVNTFQGGGGGDRLTGGGGADGFFFRSPADGGDAIAGFGPDDRLLFSASGFADLAAGFPLNFQDPAGLLPTTGRFLTGSAPLPIDDIGTLLYDTQTGLLQFDADGTGPTPAVPLAVLAGAPLLAIAQLTVLS